MLDHLIDVPEELLRVDRSNNILIEYTTNCNLRCSYCAVSQPNWPGRDLDPKFAEFITKAVINRKPKYVVIHGHGETTIIDGWEKYAEQLFKAGIGVNICSNLAKTYSDEEITTLSKLNHLTVSIDTIDPALFRKLRRGGDVRQVLFNLFKIITEAKNHDRPLDISWSIVCSDKTVWGLHELVKHGIQMGVRAFTFCNLGVLPTPEGALETKHVSELPVEDCKKAITMFEAIEQLCEQHDCIYDMKAGIIDTLRAKAND